MDTLHFTTLNDLFLSILKETKAFKRSFNMANKTIKCHLFPAM